jgi:hypothetical protein
LPAGALMTVNIGNARSQQLRYASIEHVRGNQLALTIGE